MLESDAMHDRVNIGEGNFKKVYASKNGQYAIKVIKTNLLDCLINNRERILKKERNDYLKIKTFFTNEGLGYVIPRTKFTHGSKGQPVICQVLQNIGSEVNSSNISKINTDELDKIVRCVTKYREEHNTTIDLFGRQGINCFKNKGNFYSLENLMINDDGKLSLIDYGIHNKRFIKIISHNYIGLKLQLKRINGASLS